MKAVSAEILKKKCKETALRLGYINPTVFFFVGKELFEIDLTDAFGSPEDKQEADREIRKLFKTINPEAVIFMTEASYAQLEDTPEAYERLSKTRVSNLPDAVGIIVLSFENKNERNTWYARIQRDSEMKIIEIDDFIEASKQSHGLFANFYEG